MPRLLIADDHPFLRAGIEAVLRNSPYEVVASMGNGAEALEAIRSLDPDIVLLDVAMPVLDGIQVLEQLRAAGYNLPVVLLTAELGDVALLRALRANVNGIILKNGAEDTLISCLGAVMKGQRAVPRDLLERALTLTLSAEQPPLSELAPREQDIVKLVRLGLRNREIARRLSMSEGTVKFYLHEIYRKLNVSNRTELAMLAGRGE